MRRIDCSCWAANECLHILPRHRSRLVLPILPYGRDWALNEHVIFPCTIIYPSSGPVSVENSSIYQCGTIRKLVVFLKFGQIAADPSEEAMQALYERYTHDLPITCRQQATKDPRAKVVILTGSTGSLGSYRSHLLLNDDAYVEFICLNRSSDAGGRRLKSMKEKGLCTAFDRKPILFFRGYLLKPYLG